MIPARRRVYALAVEGELLERVPGQQRFRRQAFPRKRYFLSYEQALNVSAKLRRRGLTVTILRSELPDWEPPNEYARQGPIAVEPHGTLIWTPRDDTPF